MCEYKNKYKKGDFVQFKKENYGYETDKIENYNYGVINKIFYDVSNPEQTLIIYDIFLVNYNVTELIYEDKIINKVIIKSK